MLSHPVEVLESIWHHNFLFILYHFIPTFPNFVLNPSPSSRKLYSSISVDRGWRNGTSKSEFQLKVGVIIPSSCYFILKWLSRILYWTRSREIRKCMFGGKGVGLKKFSTPSANFISKLVPLLCNYFIPFCTVMFEICTQPSPEIFKNSSRTAGKWYIHEGISAQRCYHFVLVLFHSVLSLSNFVFNSFWKYSQISVGVRQEKWYTWARNLLQNLSHHLVLILFHFVLFSQILHSVSSRDDK